VGVFLVGFGLVCGVVCAVPFLGAVCETAWGLRREEAPAMQPSSAWFFLLFRRRAVRSGFAQGWWLVPSCDCSLKTYRSFRITAAIVTMARCTAPTVQEEYHFLPTFFTHIF
jgi:hypothetical protein